MKTKKFLSMVLALAMAITTFSALPLTANAAELVFSSGQIYKTAKPLSELPLTYEATVKLPAGYTERAGIIAGNYKDVGTTSISFEVQTYGNPKIYVQNNSSVLCNILFNNVNICTGDWVHVAIVIDNGYAICYVNGQEKQRAAINYPGTMTLPNPLCLGADLRSDNAQYFKGNIKNVALYRDVRTAAEIASDWTASTIAQDGLIGGYVIPDVQNGVNPSKIEDISGNGYDFFIPVIVGANIEGRGSVTGTGSYIEGDSVTLTATPKNGYIFAGWYNGDELVEENAIWTFEVTENVSYTAKFEFAANVDDTITYFYEDFEAETNATSWVTAAENRTGIPFQTWGATSVIQVVTGNDNNYLSVVRVFDVFPLSQTTQNGKYKFEFDIKPHSYTCSATNWASEVFQVSLGGTGNDYHAVAIGSSAGASLTGGSYPVDKLTLFESKTMTISEDGGWIHIEVEYNCEAGVITATAADEKGTTVTATNTMATVSSTSPKCTFEQQANFGAVYIDNIKISDVVETQVPVVNASNIKIYAGDDEQNAAKASALTDRVVIDFGQSMYTGDMNDSLIYIVNKTTSEKVAYEGTYNSKVYTMDLEDGLSVDTTYTIHIGEVRNNGMLSSDVYELDFTVTSGIFAELIGIKQNNVAVNSASSLTAGAATIELKYNNSTDTNKIYVIVAYYKDDQLVNVDYVEQPINTNQPTTTLNIGYTVPAIDGGFDEVNVMVWENFVNLVPVCDNIVF